MPLQSIALLLIVLIVATSIALFLHYLFDEDLRHRWSPTWKPLTVNFVCFALAVIAIEWAVPGLVARRGGEPFLDPYFLIQMSGGQGPDILILPVLIFTLIVSGLIFVRIFPRSKIKFHLFLKPLLVFLLFWMLYNALIFGLYALWITKGLGRETIPTGTNGLSPILFYGMIFLPACGQMFYLWQVIRCANGWRLRAIALSAPFLFFRGQW